MTPKHVSKKNSKPVTIRNWLGAAEQIAEMKELKEVDYT